MKYLLATARARWKEFAMVLGTINGYILFAILWLIGVGVYAVAYHILLFVRGASSAPKSYWKEKELHVATAEKARQQF